MCQEEQRQTTHTHSHHARHAGKHPQKWAFWGIGIGSLLWLLFRSGTKPRRLTYPCQRVALANSVGFLGYLASLLGISHLYHKLKRKNTWSTAVGLTTALGLVLILTTSYVPATPTYAALTLPAWTHAAAISDVFAVANVPAPECSLDGGILPATAPCNTAGYALRDAGVDDLLAEMETQGDYFYKTTAHTSGIVGADDVVVIKINNQWAENGGGRLVTNSDALKGVIWRILQHPESFSGEIIVAENTQGVISDWNHTPANAQDQSQSYQDVINAFRSLGHPVSLYRWDDLNSTRISGGAVDAAGYPSGEYANGNASDAYILLEDSAASGTNELSYPKFQSSEGISLSMRYGVWNGSSYESERLTLINMPVLKQHGMAGATIAWKNFIGFLTISDTNTRFTNWDTMHGYFWGYQDMGDTSYGLLGRQLALIRTPDLNIVDAIWVADNNYDGTATRQDILLASRDPFAVDWYASEYILHALYSDQDASAARNGIFRSATRVNQNSAAAAWSGSYPYIDLLDSYNGDTPSDDEKNQMNIYIAGGSAACEPVTAVNISGATSGYTDTTHAFNAHVVPLTASPPFTYTWEPEPDSEIPGATVSYTWALTGTQTISVSVENCGGTASDTHDIVIGERITRYLYLPLILKSYTPAPVQCDVPLSGVIVSGATSGYTNTLYTFTAAIAPSNASLPLQYTWTPAPDSGQGSASVAYQWDSSGSKTINVSVSNCGGAFGDGHSITIQNQPGGDLVQPADIVYQGAFRLPGEGEKPLTFAYGGNAMTFNPAGDLGNSDIYSGSLFVMGHNRQAWGELPNGNQVAEIAIPAPAIEANPADLPQATFVQNFQDVTAGYFTAMEEIPEAGMQYLDHPDTGAKIHLAWGQHLQPENEPSHAWFNPDLTTPALQGVWFIGTQDLNRVNGYLFDIPTAWADTHASGRYLATGRYKDGGVGSMGPTLFAYRPWLSGGNAPVTGTHIAETTLLLYENASSTADLVRCQNGYQHPDEWEGGAWLSTPSGKSAVLFAGTKSNGTKFWYGYINSAGSDLACVEETELTFVTCRMANGDSCPAGDFDGCPGHASEKGWWSTHFDAQLILYNPADLAQVAAGTMETWDPQPYASIDIDEHLYLNPSGTDVGMLGSGEQRRYRIGAVSYDQQNGYLYVLELFADDAKPVVHVWQIQ